MHAAKVISTLVLSVMLSACTLGDPYGLTMQPTPHGTVTARIRGDRHRVEQYALNAVRIDSGASLGVRITNITDGIFSSELLLDERAEVLIHMRTTPHAMRSDNGSGPRLRMTATQAELMLDDGRIRRYDLQSDTGKPMAVTIVNDGHQMNITLGCTNLGSITTSAPATEWVVVEPSRRGRVELVDPTFFPLYDNE